MPTLQEEIERQIAIVKKNAAETKLVQVNEYEIRSIKEDIENAQKTLVELNRPVQSTFFQKLFTSAKKKNEIEAERQRKIAEAQEVIENGNVKLQQIQELSERLDNQEKEYIDSIRSNLRHTIKIAIENNPRLLEDEQFMTDCVKVDVNYAFKDKTNSNKVMLAYLEKCKELLEIEKNNNKCSQDEYQSRLEVLNEIIAEINNPSQVDAGKYKIPHKYMFEFIKSMYVYDKKSGTYLSDTVNPESLALITYKKYDGKMAESHGLKFENLYEDKDNYLYLHNINYGHSRMFRADEADEVSKIQSSICREGLRLTGCGNEACKIKYTTLNTKDDELGFLSYMTYWVGEEGSELGNNGIVVLQIPKKYIDAEKDVIGFKTEKGYTAEDTGVVLPEFVVGYIKGGEYHENDVPLAERTQYKYRIPDQANVQQNNKIFGYDD